MYLQSEMTSKKNYLVNVDVDTTTEKLKTLKKAQNNKIAKCCILGLIETVHGR